MHRSTLAALTFAAASLALAPMAAADGPFADRAVATFIAADGNGDEHLSYEEFRSFIATMAAHGQPTSQRIRAFGAYRMAFRRIDANGDGLASPNELRAADRSHRAEQS